MASPENTVIHFSPDNYPPATAEKIYEYCNLLQQWNRITNLTSVSGLDNLILKHAADSLACEHLVSNVACQVADIGSGAGIPGIFLAMVRPASTVYSFDKSAKKIAFQQHCRSVLQLPNFFPQGMNLSRPDETMSARFDLIVTRAFADTETALQAAAFLLKPGGSIMLWKSQHQTEPIGCERLGFFCSEMYHYRLHYKTLQHPGKTVRYIYNP